jgi:hypothetical protein
MNSVQGVMLNLCRGDRNFRTASSSRADNFHLQGGIEPLTRGFSEGGVFA